MIENDTELYPNDPAVVGPTLTANLAGTPAFAVRRYEFNAKSVDDYNVPGKLDRGISSLVSAN